MNWDAAGFALTGALLTGTLIMVWFKFSRDHAELKKDVRNHTGQIAIILVEKASCSDMLKLTDAVNKLQQQMIDHHADPDIHRTRDFEARMDSLAASLHNLAGENRREHAQIMSKIEGKS